MSHHYEQLIALFDACFSAEYQTFLIRGDAEPLYLPASVEVAYHQVIFANGFYASALHEIAHWCIASKARRQQIDYGYWYCPDGRDQVQQIAFEQVEIKPQALEWIFCIAAGFSFQVSCDNLDGNIMIDRLAFQQRVYQQVEVYLQKGLPSRAQRFLAALQAFYAMPKLHFSQFVY